MAFPIGWGRRQKISIDALNVSGAVALANFPMLVTLDHLNAEIIDAGVNSALNGGGDIRFSSDSAGTMQLACEVVSFVSNVTPASRKCEIWVKIPTLSATVNTDFYIWYNKAGEVQPLVSDPYGTNAVWSDYLYVSHNGSEDATGNHTITTTGIPVEIAGPDALAALDYNTGKYTSAPMSTSLAGAVSFSHWHKADNNTNAARSFALRDSGNSGFSVTHRAGQNIIFCGPDVSNANWGRQLNGTKAAATLVGNWYHIQGAMAANDGSGNKAILTALTNGADMVAVPDAVWWSEPDASQVNIAHRGAGVSQFDGGLSFSYVRLGILSTDWFTTEHANQNNSASFALAGVPEAVAAGPALDIHAATCGHTADNFSLAQFHALNVQNATQGQISHVINLGQIQVLAVTGSNHGQTTNGPTLIQGQSLMPAQGLHGLSNILPALSQLQMISISGGIQNVLSDIILLNMWHFLEITRGLHALMNDAASLYVPASYTVNPARLSRAGAARRSFGPAKAQRIKTPTNHKM